MPQRSAIVAIWSDAGVVQVWDTAKQLGELMSAVDDSGEPDDFRQVVVMRGMGVAPVVVAFTGHADEGYAVDW